MALCVQFVRSKEAHMTRTIRATMGGNGKPDREQRNQKCKWEAGKRTYISSKEPTHHRGDNFYETDMARPFRIYAGAAKILIDPFLSDDPSWDKGWSGYLAGKNSTQGGER